MPLSIPPPDSSHFNNHPEHLGRTSAPPSTAGSETLPPRRRQHAARQRDAESLRRCPRLNGAYRHFAHGVGQPRQVHRQCPTQRAQNPPRLCRGRQQFRHLRRGQHRMQLRANAGSLMATRLHQPAESTRQSHVRIPVCLAARGTSTIWQLPQPPSPKPHHHPLNLPDRPADPPIQHQRNHRLHPPSAQHRQQPAQDHPHSGGDRRRRIA